jgi:hypothetical protein
MLSVNTLQRFIGILGYIGILKVRIFVVSMIENPSHLLRRVRDRRQFVALLLVSGEARRGNISRQWICDRGATRPETRSNATLAPSLRLQRTSWAAAGLFERFVVRSSQICADMLVAPTPP